LITECNNEKNSSVNKEIYKLALIPKNKDDFGIDSTTSVDYIRSYLEGKKTIFIYSNKQGIYPEDKLVNYNEIVIKEMHKTKEIKDFIIKHEKLYSNCLELQKYLEFFIRKNKAKVI
jgi:hypothetical protein